jgi:subtilisin family serine protease
VLVSFEVPGVAPRLPNRAYVGARERRAIGAAQRALLASLGSDGFRVRHRYRALNAVAGSIAARGLLRLFAQRKRVAVELEVGGAGQLLQSVPLVNLDSVQAASFTGEGITVAILDSGIDALHPDLVDDLIAERCFCSDLGAGCCPDGSTDQSGPGSAADDNGHGTNVSGIVTSAGIVAPVGGAPDADIVAIKVLDANNTFCCTGDLVAGLDYILNERPDVDLVNMSLGTASTYSGDCDDASIANRLLAASVASLRDNGVATLAASGDDGSGAQMPAPACISSVISVGAVYDADVGAVSQFGCTDGSTAADQVACWSSGNASTASQASPLAAACAAALLEANPTAGPDGLEAALKTSPTHVVDPKNGLAFPRLDCSAALEAALHQPVPALGGGGSALTAALLIGVGLWQIRRRPES